MSTVYPSRTYYAELSPYYNSILFVLFQTMVLQRLSLRVRQTVRQQSSYFLDYVFLNCRGPFADKPCKDPSQHCARPTAEDSGWSLRPRALLHLQKPRAWSSEHSWFYQCECPFHSADCFCIMMVDKHLTVFSRHVRQRAILDSFTQFHPHTSALCFLMVFHHVIKSRYGMV